MAQYGEEADMAVQAGAVAVDVDPSSLPDGLLLEHAVDLLEQAERLRAQAARAVRVVQLRDCTPAERGWSTRQWLEAEAPVDPAEARAVLTAGRACDDAPLVAAAWERGEVPRSVVTRTAAALHGVTDPVVREAVEQAVLGYLASADGRVERLGVLLQQPARSWVWRTPTSTTGSATPAGTSGSTGPSTAPGTCRACSRPRRDGACPTCSGRCPPGPTSTTSARSRSAGTTRWRSWCGSTRPCPTTTRRLRVRATA